MEELRTTIYYSSLQLKNEKKPARRAKCTLLCIALAFLTASVVLVGTMLSYTSDYQDREVARNMFYNVLNATHTSPNTTNTEPSG